jgi:hypothetical protein
MKITIPVSLGELYDKITILQIKTDRINDKNKLKNIKKELKLLLKIAEENPIESYFYFNLFNINNGLWSFEDNIRIKHNKEEFDESFINIAKAIYESNDRRANIKKEINLKYSSDIIEEKFYKKI